MKTKRINYISWITILAIGYSLALNSTNIRPAGSFKIRNTMKFFCFTTKEYEMCKSQSAKWNSRVCFTVNLRQYDDLYCCNYKKAAFRQRDKNSYNCFYNIQTFERTDIWTSKTLAHLKLINNHGKKKPNIGRKLLQEYIHENEETQFTLASYDSSNFSEWKYQMKSILLKVLVLLLIGFTFFAILTAIVWLLSVYVLKRLKIKNALHSGTFFVVTEL